MEVQAATGCRYSAHSLATVSLLHERANKLKSKTLSPQQQKALLQTLWTILDDEFQLANTSADYRRLSAQASQRETNYPDPVSQDSQLPFATAPSTPTDTQPTSQSYTSDTLKSDAAQAIFQRQETMPAQRTTKRPAVHAGPNGPKRAKKLPPLDVAQKSIDSYLRPSGDPTSIEGPLQAVISFQSTETSFDARSPAADPVFSVEQSFDEMLSNNTSMADLGDTEEQVVPPTACPENDEFARSFSTQDIDYLVKHDPMALDPPAKLCPEKQSSRSTFKELLASHSLFNKEVNCLPRSMPFWVRYDLYRAALTLGFSVDEIYDMSRESWRADTTAVEVWAALRRLRKPGHPRTRIPKSGWPEHTATSMQKKDAQEKGNEKSVYLSAMLSFARKGQSLFETDLRPATIDQSCRFHREYGADRFMIIVLPYFDCQAAQDVQNKYPKEDVQSTFWQHLSRSPIYLVGRVWRAFFVEEHKSQNKNSKAEKSMKLHLFAVDGVDFLTPTNLSASTGHAPLSIAELLDQHLLFHKNRNSTALKLFSRIALGLSKTKPTVVLDTQDFIFCDDLVNKSSGPPKKEGKIMTDGCGLISIALAREVWEMCGNGSDLPSAFQARVGGSKGLWIVDYRGVLAQQSGRPKTIQIRDSQLKIKPPPNQRSEASIPQRTFEVLKCSTPCSSGFLNIQVIKILADRGVSRQCLADILRTDLEEYTEALGLARTDPLQLRAWTQQHHRSTRGQQGISFCGGLPSSRTEEANMLLESGFELQNCNRLRGAIQKLLRDALNDYVSRLRIKVNNSTTTYCAPGPYGILKQDEVQLAFSRPMKNSDTGLTDYFLMGDVLLSRNPALLPSDVQKRKAVFYPELSYVRDIVLFSTQGTQPLADLLSGGDYDGDRVLVIWQEALVKGFRNKEMPVLPTKEECGLKTHKKRVTCYLNSQASPEVKIDDFLSDCISFNSERSALGSCTTSHERLTYNFPDLSTPDALKLAALAGYLVDAPKQGVSIEEGARKLMNCNSRNGQKFRAVAWKPDGDADPARDRFDKCINVIDHLKFDVAQEIKESELTKYHKEFSPQEILYDDKLSGVYKAAVKRAKHVNSPSAILLGESLTDLSQQVDTVVSDWSKSAHHKDEHPQNSRGRKQVKLFELDWAQRIEIAHQGLLNIKPFKYNQQRYQDLWDDGIGKGTRWSLLRASCLYTQYYKTAQIGLVWQLAGDELCRIKVRATSETAQNPSREMTASMHNIMKVDASLVKRIYEGIDDDLDAGSDEDGDDGFHGNEDWTVGDME